MKAPQLPRTSRTAVEEAGIDIEPPPLDLEEDEGAEPEPSPPDTSAPPAEVEVGAAESVDAIDEARAEPPASSTSHTDAPTHELENDEMVSWDQAHDRLDHERNLDAGARDADATDGV